MAARSGGESPLETDPEHSYFTTDLLRRCVRVTTQYTRGPWCNLPVAAGGTQLRTGAADELPDASTTSVQAARGDQREHRQHDDHTERRYQAQAHCNPHTSYIRVALHHSQHGQS